MKFLVSGCSITHGAELHNGFMSPENIKQSFSTALAKQLNLELINVALSGGSNEYIFHSVINALEQQNDIDRVLVVWTSHTRLYWKSHNRHYFVMPLWSSSMIDLENFEMHDTQRGDVWITGDNRQIVDTLADMHKFFVDNYFDVNELSAKAKHYDTCLQHLCHAKNIKYLGLHVDDIANCWGRQPRHPNAEEHKKIAEFIFDKFYKST